MKQLRKFALVAAIALLVQVSWGQSAVHGTGTTNTIAVWTNGTTIGNSSLSQLGGNVKVNGRVTATSFTGDGTSVSNVNATKLGGVVPSALARLAQANIFTTDQTIQGNLALMGSINNALTLQGNLNDSIQRKCKT